MRTKKHHHMPKQNNLGIFLPPKIREGRHPTLVIISYTAVKLSNKHCSADVGGRDGYSYLPPRYIHQNSIEQGRSNIESSMMRVYLGQHRDKLATIKRSHLERKKCL